MSEAKTEILRRVRAAIGASAPAPAPVVRQPVVGSEVDLVELFADRLVDYHALVHRCGAADLGAVIADVLATSQTLVVPADLPIEWFAGYTGAVRRDGDPAQLSLAELDASSTVLTGCTVAIAETGTIVLDARLAQGRRALTLVPDHHVCVVWESQLVPGVAQALDRLDPRQPLTWISGPSATSDIELDRVEGVHGPRRLEVVLVR